MYRPLTLHALQQTPKNSRFLFHLPHTPRLARAILDLIKLAPRHWSLFTVPKRPADIAFLARHLVVQRIPVGAVIGLGRDALDAGDDVHVDVGHGLACFGAVLEGNVERAAAAAVDKVVPSQHLLHALHRGEQIRHFRGGQVGQALVGRQGADEDVAGQEGLEVDEGEGVGCCEEDLWWEVMSMDE